MAFIAALILLATGYMLVQFGLKQRTTARVLGYAIVAAGATILLAGLSLLFG
ncbi:MAG: hypothetical protein O2955_20755 [Planctomycetota bacterium]|nr:hypothetical protein [Planctomycetota bacterium]MDA1214941.1 hypothetical protein [Planctomycetota bacterium]